MIFDANFRAATYLPRRDQKIQRLSLQVSFEAFLQRAWFFMKKWRWQNANGWISMSDIKWLMNSKSRLYSRLLKPEKRAVEPYFIHKTIAQLFRKCSYREKCKIFFDWGFRWPLAADGSRAMPELIRSHLTKFAIIQILRGK